MPIFPSDKPSTEHRHRRTFQLRWWHNQLGLVRHSARRVSGNCSGLAGTRHNRKPPVCGVALFLVAEEKSHVIYCVPIPGGSTSVKLTAMLASNAAIISISVCKSALRIHSARSLPSTFKQEFGNCHVPNYQGCISTSRQWKKAWGMRSHRGRNQVRQLKVINHAALILSMRNFRSQLEHKQISYKSCFHLSQNSKLHAN